MKVLLVVYDNGSYIHTFPLGIAYIASVLRNAGHEVEIYSQDVHHYPDSHLTEYLDKSVFDVVGVSVIGGYYQYRKLISLSKAINASKRRPFYVLGGHGPSPEPEFFLKKSGADVICIGEGEVTAVELMDVLAGKRELRSVKGIAFMEGDKCIKTPARELIKDVDSIALPAWDMFPVDYYSLIRPPNIRHDERCMSVLSGRGCVFECNFCYRMDKGFRPRAAGAISAEIKVLKERYGISYISFEDELLMSNVRRTKELSQTFLDEDLNIKWSCNGRLNFAEPDVLKLMKKSGCVFINYGIECMDNEILKVMNKHLTVDQVTKGIEATLKEGISPGINIIFGNIGEDERTLEKGVEFLLKHDDQAQFRTIRPVTPYPGCALYYYAIEHNLLGGVEDFYENKHLNSDLMAVNFTKLSDDRFYEVLYAANKRLIDNYFSKQKDKAIGAAKRLYLERDPNFRGFRQT